MRCLRSEAAPGLAAAQAPPLAAALEGDVLGAIGALGLNAPGLDRAKQAERAEDSSVDTCCHRCKLHKLFQCGLQLRDAD